MADINGSPDSSLTKVSAPMGAEDFDALDAILDDLRSRQEDVPQWEFCEGFMTALTVCCAPVDPHESFEVLLGMTAQPDATDQAPLNVPLNASLNTPNFPFCDAAQQQHFMKLWQQRQAEIVRALQTPVQSLDDAHAYQPQIMDVRGAVAALAPDDRDAMLQAHQNALPSLAQVWALGFMYAVENWPDHWIAPADEEAREVFDAAMQCLVALTEDDTDEPTLSVFDPAGPPSVSVSRLDALADALWAVYDLCGLWHGSPQNR